MAAREVATTPRIDGPFPLFSTQLQCNFIGEGWNPSFDWHVKYSPNEERKEWDVNQFMLQQDHVSVLEDPRLKSGRYHCNVTFQMEYEGETTKLCSQTRPLDFTDAKTTLDMKQLEKKEITEWVMTSSGSRLVRDSYVCNYEKYSKLDLTTPALFHPFWTVGINYGVEGVDWEAMKGPVLKLIYAELSDCPKFVIKKEEECMTPIINEILSEVLGEYFPMKKWAEEHWFKMNSNDEEAEDCFGNQRPDGVVLSSGTPHTRVLLIREDKILEGSGDSLVQLLLYLLRLLRKTDEKQKHSDPAASRAYPVLLLEMKGKSAKLHAAIRMGGKVIHHCLLAQAEFTPGREKKCAMFLLRLQRGVEELNEFWKNGAKCMRFDSDRVLPCDCIAKLLDSSGRLHFTGHVTADVFEATVSTDNGLDLARIVKFSTHQYGQEAHERCAEKGMAPKFYKSVHLPLCCSLWVVMMEKLDGYIRLDDALLSNLSAAQTQKIKEKMKEALDVLHGGEGETRLVHGDFRSPNVLVSFQEESDDVQVRIIDFDWSGEEGRAYYPNVNVMLNWPEGVKCAAPLKVEHDWHLYRAHCHDLDWVARQESYTTD